MDSNYIVMLIAPVEEERVSMVALQLADVLNVSITKLSRLLSGRPGPLTKAIPKATADKLAKVMEQLNIQIAVVPENLEEALLFPNQPIKKTGPQKTSESTPPTDTRAKQTNAQTHPLKGGLQANFDAGVAIMEAPASPVSDQAEPTLNQNQPYVSEQHVAMSKPAMSTAFADTAFADTTVSFEEHVQRPPFRLPLIILALVVLGLAVVMGASYIIPQSKTQTDPLNETSSSLALASLISSAEAGDAEAQFELAWAYANGIDTEQSYEQAASWLQASADQGNSKAQYYLGLYYYFGHGLEQNSVAAFSWFRTAAMQGLAEAQYMLGRMYLNGDGVQANQEEALKWLYLADEKGVAEASLLISGNNNLNSPSAQNHPIFQYAQEGNLEAIRSEVDKGTNLNMRDPFGQTPLMYAVSAGEVNSLLGLIELGADVNAQSNEGWTALMYAARENAQAIALLLQHDAGTEFINNDGQKAYDIALVNHPEALISLQAASRPVTPNN